MFDTLIRGGTVIDGTGRPAFAADVAISGGRIAAIGDLPGSVRRSCYRCRRQDRYPRLY